MCGMITLTSAEPLYRRQNPGLGPVCATRMLRLYVHRQPASTTTSLHLAPLPGRNRAASSSRLRLHLPAITRLRAVRKKHTTRRVLLSALPKSTSSRVCLRASCATAKRAAHSKIYPKLSKRLSFDTFEIDDNMAGSAYGKGRDVHLPPSIHSPSIRQPI